MDAWILSAFAVGLLGSLHCAGMCGPIAVALSGKGPVNLKMILSKALYNSGRVATYAFLGLLAGFAGHTISLAGYQKPLAIGTGILILISVFIPVLFKRMDALAKLSSMYSGRLKNSFKRLFGKGSYTTMFFIGLLNGFLPCGFVYLGLAAAIASGTVFKSTLYMTFFGLGTIPMMLGLSMIGNLGGPKWNGVFRKVSPFVAVSVAILLIIRGMMATEAHCCH